jgi:hypothetical protein
MRKPASLIYSNVKEIIEHQRYLFETLWNKAIPAEQRINEIKEGVILEKTEVFKIHKLHKNCLSI